MRSCNIVCCAMGLIMRPAHAQAGDPVPDATLQEGTPGDTVKLHDLFKGTHWCKLSLAICAPTGTHCSPSL